MALKFAAMPASELKIMGENGKQFYDRELSFAMAMSRLDSVFVSIVR